MAAKLIANNFYYCDTLADRSLSWADGTGCFVAPSEGVVGKYYKLMSGVFVFKYNATETTSPLDVIDNAPTNKIIVSATQPTGTIAVGTVWIPIP